MNSDVKAVLVAFGYLAAFAIVLTVARRYLIGWLLEAPYDWAVPTAFVVGAAIIAGAAVAAVFAIRHVARILRQGDPR